MNINWTIAFAICFFVLMLMSTGFVAIIFRFIKIYRKDKLTDEDTSIGNLQYFKQNFNNLLTDENRDEYYAAYIILDISYLRSYHGSSFEDTLQYTAKVINSEMKSDEFCARITENGFAACIKCQDAVKAQERLEALVKKLNSFERKSLRDNKIVFHCAAYKLCFSDRNCEILLFNLRKNCNSIFGTSRLVQMCDIHSMNRIQEEKRNHDRIINAFDNGEFKMYLQFVVNNKTKEIISCEALSRWESPENGIVIPGLYISNMEQLGIIGKHDFYMFELACRQLEKWNGTKYGYIPISCNFTRSTLSEENFTDKLESISKRYNFDRSKLGIEITEDVMEKNRETVNKNVVRCKEMGFLIYLDDMGSGYTSLANLCDYPTDIVKIDRDILLKAHTQRGLELFNGIVALAHSLNMKVICEGVETEEQVRLVDKTECDFVQGWYYSKPVSSDKCERFLDNYDKSRKEIIL